VFFFGACLCSLRLRLRGFHDLLRDKASSLLMMLVWSSESVAPLMIQFFYVNFLVRILVLCIWIQWPRFRLC
jgi:hypothetical protein